MITSAYIHIPFCAHICSYCDFPKLYYHQPWVYPYLESLSLEIQKYYKGEPLKTIYIGGGTPTSLTIEELEQLFKILNNLKKAKNIEYTIECNLENLTEEKLDLMKFYGVNRISIGIQSFQKKNLEFLNRVTANTRIIEYAKKIGFDNINVDFIYAIPEEEIGDIKNDIEEFLKLGIPHISTYSLIIEEGTMLNLKKIKPIDSEKDRNMYEYIVDKLIENGYQHYEISNFCKPRYESKHNLTYWNNEEYYGFGMGASGYIGNIRYTNTKSIQNYINGKYHYDEEVLTTKEKMEYEMILGLRKIEGVSIKQFKKKYGRKIEEVFPIDLLLENGYLIKKDGYLKIKECYLYTSNDILIHFI